MTASTVPVSAAGDVPDARPAVREYAPANGDWRPFDEFMAELVAEAEAIQAELERRGLVVPDARIVTQREGS